MATGLIPVLWQLFRVGAVAFIEDRKQLALSALSVIAVLNFAYQTAFVVDGDAGDTVAAAMVPWVLLGLYIFFPVGVFLFTLIKKSLTTHVVLGVIMLVLFGSATLGLLSFSLMQMFFAGSLAASVIYLLSLVEVLYDMRHKTKRLFMNAVQVVTALFVSAFLSAPVDWLLNHTELYRRVIEDAKVHMPANISITAGDPQTIHYFVWLAAIMLILLQVLRSLRLRSAEEIIARREDYARSHVPKK